MPEYRIYRLLPTDKIAGPSTLLICSSDQEVVIEAQKLLNGLDIEIWDGPRVVRRLRSQDAR